MTSIHDGFIEVPSKYHILKCYRLQYHIGYKDFNIWIEADTNIKVIKDLKEPIEKRMTAAFSRK